MTPLRLAIPAGLLLLIHGSFAADPAIPDTVKTNFAPDHTLTSAERVRVIKLAKESGIPDVAEVSTFNNYRPSPCFSIGVKSKEITRGREVTFVTATIDCEKWTSKEIKRSSKIFKSSGEFWLDRRYVYTNVLTTFSVPGGTALVHLSDDTPLPVADRIVNAFATGKIRYADGVNKEKLKRADLSQPTGLGSYKKKLSIGFSTGPMSGVMVEFTLDDDGVGVTVVDIWEWVI